MNSGSGGTTIERSPLERLARARALLLHRALERQFPVTVYGVYPTERSLVLSAPVGADGGLIAVMRDQPMGCRWSSPVAVYTFRAMVSELAFRPHPVLHAGQINSVQRFTRRKLPRVATALPATLHADQSTEPALLTDLSVAGAQVALARGRTLQAGQRIQIGLRLRLLEQDRILRLDCTVVADRGEPDPDHPLVHFFGVRFVEPDEITTLVLLGYVQQLQMQQGDQLGRLLQAGATESAPRD